MSLVGPCGAHRRMFLRAPSATHSEMNERRVSWVRRAQAHPRQVGVQPLGAWLTAAVHAQARRHNQIVGARRPADHALPTAELPRRENAGQRRMDRKGSRSDPARHFTRRPAVKRPA